MSFRSINILTICGIDLSSRSRASAVRNEILQAVDILGNRIAVDFDGVRTVSHSFADELFAVLILERGEVWFRENIEVRNAKPNVRYALLEAISERVCSRPIDSTSCVEH